MSDETEAVDLTELTLSVEGELVDMFLTEDDIEPPTISGFSDVRTGVVGVHIPLLFEASEDPALSENFVHSELTPEQARAFAQQLEAAADEVEAEQ